MVEFFYDFLDEGIMNFIEKRLQEVPFLILDGAVSTEIERRGVSVSDSLWGASALADHPGVVEAVHESYYEAGADIVTSDSYQATIQGLTEKGYTEEESKDILRKSVALVRRAQRKYKEKSQDKRPLFVAASLGPYGAYLGNGGEYRGNYGKSVEELKAFHRLRFSLLAEAGADVLACETIPSFNEVKALVSLLHDWPCAMAWFSFSSVDGKHMAEGVDIGEAVRYLYREKQVIAIGVNCIDPSYGEGLIKQMKKSTEKPIIIYANSGEVWDTKCDEWSGHAVSIGRYAEKWIAAGAKIIGGCCRTTPEDVKELKEIRNRMMCKR